MAARHLNSVYTVDGVTRFVVKAEDLLLRSPVQRTDGVSRNLLNAPDEGIVVLRDVKDLFQAGNPL
jgi:hypothetical protein